MGRGGTTLWAPPLAARQTESYGRCALSLVRFLNSALYQNAPAQVHELQFKVATLLYLAVTGDIHSSPPHSSFDRDNLTVATNSLTGEAVSVLKQQAATEGGGH